jgi:hypothetical protein
MIHVSNVRPVPKRHATLGRPGSLKAASGFDLPGRVRASRRQSPPATR